MPTNILSISTNQLSIERKKNDVSDLNTAHKKIVDSHRDGKMQQVVLQKI